MAIRATCPGCKATLTVADELAGKKVRCGKCPQVFIVGTLAQASGSAAVKESSPRVGPARTGPGGPPAQPEPRTVSPKVPATAAAPRHSAKESSPRPETAARRPREVSRTAPFLAGLVVGMLLVGGAWAGVWFLNKENTGGPDQVGVDKKDTPVLLTHKIPPNAQDSPTEPSPAVKEPVKEPVQAVKEPARQPEPVAPGPKKDPEPVAKEPKKNPGPVLQEPKKAPEPAVKEPKKGPEPAAPGPKKGPEPADPLAIKAPALDQDTVERTLTGAVGRVAVGGAGRFLILHLPSVRKLAIFDVNEAKVVQYLPLAEDNVQFAAGLDQLIIYLPTANLFQRWNLVRREREAVVPNRLKGTVHVMAMGSASQGPLVIGAKGQPGGLVFLDPKTFKEIKYTPVEGGGMVTGGVSFDHYPPTLRVGPDGQVIGLWTPGLSPSGLRTAVLRGKTIKYYYEHTSVGHILPGSDGKTLFMGAGLYTTELKPLGKRPTGVGSFLMPAVEGPYYLAFLKKGFERTAPVKVTLHLLGDERPLATVTDLEGLEDYFDPVKQATRSQDLPVFLVPDAKLLVQVPLGGDKLVLHRLDVDKALESSGIDYLVVASQAPASAERGKTYAYQLAVKSKKGGVKYRLDSGPKGMAVSDAGKLTWEVPADYGPTKADVIVSVSDRGGQETFHTFQIKVGGRSAEAPAPGPAVAKEGPAAKGPDPLAGNVEEEAAFDLPGFGGMVLLPDQVTLIVSSPESGELIYIDTFKNKELRRVEVNFKPGSLALQGGKLYASAQGASAIHVLDPQTGKEQKEFSLSGGPIASLACHPSSGPLFAVTEDHAVLVVDPATGKSEKTDARGQTIAVDPVDGQTVYTGVQTPIRDQLRIRRGPRRSVNVTVVQTDRFGLLLKYRVKPSAASRNLRELELVAANDAAAINGRGIYLSPDGKSIAMIGGGGWQPKTNGGRRYVIAVYDTKDLKTMRGQVDTGAYPAFLTLHPTLNLGAAASSSPGKIFLFNARSFAAKQKITAPPREDPWLATFVGRGTKLAYLSGDVIKKSRTLHLVPLELKDEDRAALRKAQAGGNGPAPAKEERATEGTVRVPKEANVKPEKPEGPQAAKGGVDEEAAFDLASFGGWALLADGSTLVVSSPASGELVYLDTFKNKELRRVELGFKPDAMALQGGQLFVAAKGASAIHVLDAETGKDQKEIKLPTQPIKSLACHPVKGPIFAVTEEDEVITVDPVSGKAGQTVGRGQVVVVDPVDGKTVYTAVQNPIRERLNVRRGPRGSIHLSVTKVGRFGLLLKYRAIPSKSYKNLMSLKLVASNDAAAINGRGLYLSPDGKSIAMIGGGGWQPKTNGNRQYVIAVYDTKDLKTMRGQVDTGPYPAGLALHPTLGLGAAANSGPAPTVFLFNARSFAIKQKIKVPAGEPGSLIFAGRGTKLAYVSGKTGKEGATVNLVPLELKDEERQALQKSGAEK